MYAESQMTAEVLREAMKEGEAVSAPGDGQGSSGKQGAMHDQLADRRSFRLFNVLDDFNR